MNYFRIKSVYNTSQFNEINNYSKSEKKDRDLICQSNYIKIINNEKYLADLIQFGKGFILISKKLLEIIKNNSNNEIIIYPVRIALKNIINEYYYLETPSVEYNIYKEERSAYLDLNNIYLNYEEIHDFDFINIRNTSELVCSNKIKKIIEENDCKNIIFEKIDPVALDADNNPISYYSITTGNANKYFWFKPIDKISKINGKWDFSGNIYFERYSGTNFGDIHGSTLAENFFSEKFVNYINSDLKNTVNIEKVYFKNLNEERTFFHLIPEIKILKISSHSGNGCIHTPILLNTKMYEVNESVRNDIFKLENTRYIIIPNYIKHRMEREGFKNVYFKKMRYKGITT